MISTLFDVITKLSSYAMVIFFAMFAYFKVTGKHGKYPYGKYALVSLILLIVFGTLFFNSPKGKQVIKKGNAEQAERTEKTGKTTAKQSTKSTQSSVKQTLDKTHALLFNHQVKFTTQNSDLTIEITDKRDTVGSFKLATVDILKAIKNSRFEPYDQFTIIFNRKGSSGQKRIVLKSTFTKKTLEKLNPAKTGPDQLKANADSYYEAK
ncbi:hypothetical protein LASUN_11480 [Lentilactobacillus sunkii]|uniref:Uncharacterized protein n=1 Tax=Lentilactobacillus sunkii TaxID=481719 RepID=A0A1E7XD96_9LACO|nr:hypothetical protein [Lentilactobacillus sunkii]OFA11076.1 hypothetical protein LASUN_11480 [Lentilactobacillus sunkii]